jgi:hypothetical protein
VGNIENRPYAGTWKLNNRSVVKYTPDALVFINGDTSLPGCPRCRGRIEIQKFVTSISVEAGTTPVSHSANINLSLPRVQGQQVFIDGYNILRAGLEVHVFMRGYFPVRGMFSHLSDPQAGREIQFANPSNNDRLDLSKYSSYPYYPVFHGVITNVSYEYSDGFYHGSLQCASLLHFWQYQNIATAGAWMAQDRKPHNDPARPTLYGHNFNNVHPFGIMYTLYRDVSAAGGVEFALDEQSNLSAPTEQGDRQLFDQVTIYWEQRFKTRMQSLRMYGVNGQLFNAAQQAWFGSASSRDVNRLLPSPTYNDLDSTRTEKDPLSARISVAKALGLGNAGLDFTYSPLIKQDDELVNLSILDMFAFTQTIGELGPGNIWQTTYQTKLDIAQAVMEVTGYEFYQDVDGDLVFKPPFYNLDTAPNRYYRLEDQDIINISFVEKEPTATYIIVRGTWFAGLTDVTKNTDELGKRGLYVDYKLVAKFGWRPAATLDITYQTDPKVLFWIGVARLDQLNVDTYSATCTIPIRAELRPGYPVYIPFCDSYYYISQHSHQFAFGGQCTTTMTLTCKRSKWHAPGILAEPPEGMSAINLVHLDRPDLPPRPLEIFNNGIPRIVGFPNVVMALDPRKFNPNFSVVGVGIDYFDSVDAPADLLFSLLQRDINQLHAFEAVGTDPGPDGKTTISDPTEIQRFRLRYGKGPADVVEFSLDDLVVAFDDYKSSREDLNSKRQELRDAKAKEALARSGENAFDPVQRMQGARDTSSSTRITELDRIDTLEGELQGALTQQNQALEQKRSHQLLALIFEALQPDSNNPIRRRVDGIAGSDVTLSWFESLSHLKGQYLCTTLPGHYRYFSCSHPNEEMQGMPIIEWDDGERTGTDPLASKFRNAIENIRQVFRPTTGAEARDLVDRMQDQLDSLGIDWITASDPFTVTDFLGRNRTAESLLGPTSSRADRNAANFLDSEIAQNLVNIAAVANQVRSRAMADPSWPPGQTIISISAFRPFEGQKAEAMHAAGLAIDLQIAGSAGFGTVENTPDPVQTAFDILRRECVGAMSAGLVTGMGTYQNPRGDGFFVHIDRRDRDALDASLERKKQVAEANGEDPDEVVSRNMPGRDFWFQEEGHHLTGTAKRAKLDQLAADAAELGVSWPPPGRRGPLRVGQDTSLFPTGTPIPNNLPVPATPTPQSGNAVPKPEVGPSIRTRELSTDVDKVVVQFRPTVTKPEAALRSPEVELGIGKCRRGLQIALGPQRTPRVLTTDQIQTISFVRHQASKFTQVVGTSQTSGQFSFNATALQKQIAQSFMDAAQDLSDPNTRVSDVFEPVYNQIATDLATDVPAYPLPVYDNGNQIRTTTIELLPFTSALPEVSGTQVPPVVLRQLGVLGAGQKPDDSIAVDISDLTVQQVAMLPGYKPQGKQMDDGRSFQRAVTVLAGDYALSITRQIENKFLELQTPALQPSTGKDQRLAAIQGAFNSRVSKAIGIERVLDMITKNTIDAKAVKEGKIDKPLHSPVFPVSDEKGYEHYGAYRYGRGLSVEPGGTFEFLHSGQDPFNNVTAQSAEEFLRVFTLVKSGKVSSDASTLKGIQDAASRMAAFVLDQRNEVLTDKLGSSGAEALVNGNDPLEDLGVQELGLSHLERGEIEQSVQDLARVVSTLGNTSQGQDALRELLSANGDNPDLIRQDSFDITDTQFARNFVNFAVNYGKSPVFKTTAANAAYQLSDLTGHLLSRAGQSCICRGSYSDVLLAAYARSNFIAVEAIDQREQKAEAFTSEQVIKSGPGHSLQQQRYRGIILEGGQPDAKNNPDGTKAGK